MRIRRVWFEPPKDRVTKQVLLRVDEMLLESKQEKWALDTVSKVAVPRIVGLRQESMPGVVIVEIPRLGKRFAVPRKEAPTRYALLTLQAYRILCDEKLNPDIIDETASSKTNINPANHFSLGEMNGMPSMTVASSGWGRVLSVVCPHQEVINELFVRTTGRSNNSAFMRANSKSEDTQFVVAAKGSELQKASNALMKVAEGLIIQVETLPQGVGALVLYRNYLEDVDERNIEASLRLG